MLTMALMHLLMIPLAYLLEIFPFLKHIVEAPLEFWVMVSDLIQG